MSSCFGFRAIRVAPAPKPATRIAWIDVIEFVTAVRSIAAHTGAALASSSAGVTRVRLPPFSGRAELREAPDKEKADLLSVEQKIELWSNECYLCGRGPALGIDREDASGNYTPSNSRPCCTDCNYMKKDMSPGDFTAHIAHIHAHTVCWVLRGVLDVPLKTCTGVKREPVGAYDAAGRLLLIFPSMYCAAKIMGVAVPTIQKAAEKNGQCVRLQWMRADSRAMRLQRKTAVECQSVFTRHTKLKNS